MKTKTLLVFSLILNGALLGAVGYIYRLIPDWDLMHTDGRFARISSFDAAPAFTNGEAAAPRQGMVTEALLPTPRHTGRAQLFNLETGRFMPEPDFEYFGNDARANVAWLRTNGLDLAGFVFEDKTPMCVGYYLAVVPVTASHWEDATPEGIAADPQLAAIHHPKRTSLTPEHLATDTFLFRTVEGTAGILQILGATADGHHVRIRYKLMVPAPVAQPQKHVASHGLAKARPFPVK